MSPEHQPIGAQRDPTFVIGERCQSPVSGSLHGPLSSPTATALPAALCAAA
jgi:hypothetical protein